MEKILFNWLLELTRGFCDATQWLTSSLKIGSITITPLVLVSFGGLTIFIAAAILKWVIS